MRKYWLFCLSIIFIALTTATWAASTTASFCTTTPGTFFSSCVPVSTANPFPVVSN